MGEDTVSRNILPPPRNDRHAKCKCPKVRQVRSKAAVLVIVWTYLVYTTLAGLMGDGRLIALHGVPNILTLASIVGFVIIVVLGPFLGLVASTYFGRHKIIYASLWLMWSGIMAIGIVLVLQVLLPELDQIVAYSGITITQVVYFIGFTAFAVNSIPFGLDQMPDASVEQITAFIHWYVWSIFAGTSTGTLLLAIHECTGFNNIHMIQSFISACLLLLALCSIISLHEWLIIEPESINPLKTVSKVLRFAARHKIPIQRSAFTYCETGLPSRIDLGKSKYGGPFNNEEVEDVKTCLRMLLVIASTSIMISTCIAGGLSLRKGDNMMFKNTDYPYEDCTLNEILFLVLAVVLSLPAYDVLIQPAVNRCLPSTLKRVGLAQVLTVSISFILLVISIIWYTYEHPDQCMLTSKDKFLPLPVQDLWFEVPMMLLGISLLFLFSTAIVEFVCAQAPYNLRGLLIGTVQSAVYLSSFLGAGIYGVWSLSYQREDYNGSICGIWYNISTAITAVVGCVVWCIVAKWYKKRERDELDMYRVYVENYYDC